MRSRTSSSSDYIAPKTGHAFRDVRRRMSIRRSLPARVPYSFRGPLWSRLGRCVLRTAQAYLERAGTTRPRRLSCAELLALI